MPITPPIFGSLGDDTPSVQRARELMYDQTQDYLSLTGDITQHIPYMLKGQRDGMKLIANDVRKQLRSANKVSRDVLEEIKKPLSDRAWRRIYDQAEALRPIAEIVLSPQGQQIIRPEQPQTTEVSQPEIRKETGGKGPEVIAFDDPGGGLITPPRWIKRFIVIRGTDCTYGGFEATSQDQIDQKTRDGWELAEDISHIPNDLWLSYVAENGLKRLLARYPSCGITPDTMGGGGGFDTLVGDGEDEIEQHCSDDPDDLLPPCVEEDDRRPVDETNGDGIRFDHPLLQMSYQPCLWDPGDPNLCLGLDQLRQDFQELGRLILDAALSPDGHFAVAVLQIHKILRTLPWFGDPLGKMWLNVKFNQFNDWIKTVRDNMPMVVKESIPGLLYLNAVRMILTAFENVEVGWDLGPKATTIMQFRLTTVLRIVDYLINYTCPVEVPNQPWINNIWTMNLISEEHAECLSKMNGNSWTWGRKLAFAHRSLPTADLLARHWFRFRTTPDEFKSLMRNYGWLESGEADLVRQMHEWLPPPSDLIRFAVKDVFLPDKLGRSQMLVEYGQQINLKELFAAQGIGKLSIRTEDGRTITEDMGECAWLAHYHNISPTQAFTMLHRLRPDRVQRFAFTDTQGQQVVPGPVNIDIVRRMLREDDYNPFWRDRLAAISHRVVTRVDARRIYKVGGYGPVLGMAGFDAVAGGGHIPSGVAERELAENYRDLGYLKDDADRLAYFTATDRDLTISRPAVNRQKTLLCQMYTAGTIDRDELVKRLEPLMQSKPAAELMADNCDMEFRVKRTQAAVRAIKVAYLRGMTSSTQADAELIRLQIPGDRREDYLRLWQLELKARQKEVTADRFCSWYGSGLIGKGEMMTRLLRIGYDQSDADRIIRHCEIGHAAKGQKERDKWLKAQIREQRRLQRLAEIARKAADEAKHKKATAELSGRTAANMKRWWELQILSEAEIRETLEFRGWLPVDIDRWVHANRPST